MKKCLCVFFLYLVLSQSCIYSQSISLSEQIEQEVQILIDLQKNYQIVEEQLEQSQMKLTNVETSYKKMTQDLQELSKDYEKSEKELKFWKTFVKITVPASFIFGLIIGSTFGKSL